MTAAAAEQCARTLPVAGGGARITRPAMLMPFTVGRVIGAHFGAVA